jgi:hypothetical protein
MSKDPAAHASTMNDERMVKTTAEERSEAARKAVQVHWAKAKKAGKKKETK